MQQGRHLCLHQHHPTLTAAHRAAVLQPRQPRTAQIAAAAVAQLQELEQLQPQQQLQQLEVPLYRPADAVTSYTSNRHSSESITSSSSTAQQLMPVPCPRPISYTAQQTRTSLVSLLVIEAFAGSYSAGRLTARLNSSSTGICVAAYAAVELDPAFMQRAPDSTIFGIPDHENRTMIINGSITDPAVHGKLLLFVQQLLQQSADGRGPVIDGVMLLGGPPCTMYSNCQTYQLPLVIEPDPDSFRRKLFASDRVVTGFLQLYSIIKTVCADTRWPHPTTKQSVPSCILMENPFSPSYMPIKYTPQEVAASQGQLKPRQIKMIEKQNLSGRHFLQPYLAHTGGQLYVSLHCWCSYAHLTHPKKPTYVFSDLKGLQDTPCICRLCRPEGKNLKSTVFSASGRLIESPVYQQHYIKVQEMANGDGGERATWPDAWLDRMAWLFSTSILAQRRRCYSSSSSGRSSCHSGGSGFQLPVNGRQRMWSSTGAGDGSSTAANGSTAAAGNGCSTAADGSSIAGNGSSVTAAGIGSSSTAAGDGSSIAGNGSSVTAAGNGSSVTAAGNGSNVVAAANGSSSTAAGNGSSVAAAGDGISFAGNGSSSTAAGDGISFAGNGSSSTAAGTGSSVTAAGDGISFAGNLSSVTAAGDGSSLAGNGSITSATGGGNSSKLISPTGSGDVAAAAVDAALHSSRGSGASRARRRRSRQINSSSSSSSNQSSNSQRSATSSSGQSSSAGNSNTSSSSSQSSASSSGHQVSRQHDDDTPQPSSSTASSSDQSRSNKSCAGRSNAASSSYECVSPGTSGQRNASSGSSSFATRRPSSSSSSTGGSGETTEGSNSSRRRTRGNSRSRASSSSSSGGVSKSSASIGSSVNSSSSSNRSTRSDQDRGTMERHRQLPSIFDMPL